MNRLATAETTVAELSRFSDEQKTQIDELSKVSEQQKSELNLLTAQKETLQSRLKLSEDETDLLIGSLLEVQKNQGQQQSEPGKQNRGTSLIEFPPLDVVIALDSTGSMRAQTEGLRTEITQFAKLMRELSPSVSMGVVEYKDRCDSQTIRSFDLVEMNAATIPQIQAFANGVEAGGDYCNSDGPEALKSALETATQMNWRPDVGVQLIVIVTDNSAYREEEAEAFGSHQNLHREVLDFQSAQLKLEPTGKHNAFWVNWSMRAGAILFALADPLHLQYSFHWQDFDMRTIKIGRDKSCDVCLSEQSISKIHAELVITNDKKLFLNDCGSKNGTFVFRSGLWDNLRQEFIQLSDWVRFGDVEMRGGDILLHLREADAKAQSGGVSKGASQADVISGPVRRNEFGEPTRRE